MGGADRNCGPLHLPPPPHPRKAPTLPQHPLRPPKTRAKRPNPPNSGPRTHFRPAGTTKSTHRLAFPPDRPAGRANRLTGPPAKPRQRSKNRRHHHRTTARPTRNGDSDPNPHPAARSGRRLNEEIPGKNRGRNVTRGSRPRGAYPAPKHAHARARAMRRVIGRTRKRYDSKRFSTQPIISSVIGRAANRQIYPFDTGGKEPGTAAERVRNGAFLPRDARSLAVGRAGRGPGGRAAARAATAGRSGGREGCGRQGRNGAGTGTERGGNGRAEPSGW